MTMQDVKFGVHVYVKSLSKYGYIIGPSAKGTVYVRFDDEREWREFQLNELEAANE